MATFGAIRAAIRDALETIPELNAYSWIPDSIVVPAAIVAPASPFIEYQTRFGSGKARWRLYVTFLTVRVDEESAQSEVDALISPGGPVITALHASDLGAGIDFASVVRAERYGSFRVGDTSYLGVQLLVEVTA